MSIKTRLPQIKQQVTKVSLLLKKNSYISHWGMRSITDETVNYQTKVEWFGIGIIEDFDYIKVQILCEKVIGKGMYDCQGNTRTICRHSLASLIKASELKNKSLILFDHFSDATRFANFGGQLIQIFSVQSNKYCWGVIQSQQQKQQVEIKQVAQDDPHLAKRLERMNDRVDMMRGQVEGGIN